MTAGGTPSARPECCALCGFARLSLLYDEIVLADLEPGARRRRSIWACTRCHAYWSLLPPGLGSVEYYHDKPEGDHLQLEVGRQRFRRVRRALEEALGTERYRLLDVGCATGAHLDVYGERVEKFGIEPAVSAIASLQRRGITWLGSSVKDAPAASFDAVTSLDVIEHIEHPRCFLEGLDRCLAPGGVLAIVTGDIDSLSARWGGRRWLYYALPEHCAFYSAAALQRYWVQHGYRPLRRMWIANTDVTASYVMSFVSGVAKEAIAKVLPRERVRKIENEGRLRFPFFCDNMLLTFRKR